MLGKQQAPPRKQSQRKGCDGDGPKQEGQRPEKELGRGEEEGALVWGQEIWSPDSNRDVNKLMVQKQDR